MKIRIESSSSNRPRKTGVGYYARRLTDSLRELPDVEVRECQFDFLGRQLSADSMSQSSVERINFPQKIYAKLDYLGVAHPFDLFKKRVDVTIFPNYALWPTIWSHRNAVTIHDLSYLKYPEVVEEKNLRYLQRVVPRSIHRADLVLTVSESVKTEIIEHFGVDSDKIHVTPIPPTEEYSVRSDRDVYLKYKIPTKDYILFASTIEPRKNLDVLLDAYGSLSENERAAISLVIAGGTGWRSENTIDKLKKLQLHNKNIVTTGYYDQADAAALYQQATMFVMPSRYEGFGMPLLEAMAAKTPTIASDISVLREVGGDASLFFKPDDPHQLRDQIQLLLKDDGVRKKYVTKGTENLKRYSWQYVAEDLVKKLKSV